MIDNHLVESDAVRVSKRFANGCAEVETYGHDVGGFKMRLKGTGYQDETGEIVDGRIVLEAWKHASYFEESDEFAPFTTREARQMAHLLMAIAEEVDGWADR